MSIEIRYISVCEDMDIEIIIILKKNSITRRFQ
jgi:hypothetical protein